VDILASIEYFPVTSSHTLPILGCLALSMADGARQQAERKRFKRDWWYPSRALHLAGSLAATLDWDKRYATGWFRCGSHLGAPLPESKVREFFVTGAARPIARHIRSQQTGGRGTGRIGNGRVV